VASPRPARRRREAFENHPNPRRPTPRRPSPGAGRVREYQFHPPLSKYII